MTLKNGKLKGKMKMKMMEEWERKRAKRDGEWRKERGKKEQEKEGKKDMRHAEKNEHCAGNLRGSEQ